MLSATHRLGGLASGIIFASAIHIPLLESGMLITGAVLGSLMPDIDNPNSTISRKMKGTSFIVRAGQGGIRLISDLLPRKQREYVRSLIGHRGLTHSLIPVAAVWIAAFVTDRFLIYGIAAGLISHLVLDILSGGVPLFLPLTTKRVTIAHIKTGGAVEWFFRVILAGILIYFGYREVISWLELLHV